jgi:hypothetical protein
MKTVIIAISILWYCSTTAQTTNTVASVDTSFLKYKTAEEALGLPSSYKVLNCEIVYSGKGEIFKMDGSQWGNAQFRALIARAKKGDKLYIGETTVIKDGIKKKMGAKIFTF